MWKTAALESVTTQANNGLDMHMSFAEGMPIITSLTLNFKEVDVITRNDQRDAPNNVGY